MNGLWPRARLAEAVELLARLSNFGTPAHDSESHGESIEALARWQGCEAEAVTSTYAGLDRHLCSLAPGIVDVGESGYLVIVGAGRRHVRVVGPDLRGLNLRIDTVSAALRQPLEAEASEAVDRLIEDTGIPDSRRAGARAALLAQRLGHKRIFGLWVLRPAPTTPVYRQMQLAGVPRRVVLLAAVHAVQYMLWIAAWWILGAAAFSGRFDRGWFVAWCLLLATLIPCRLWMTWLQGSAAILAGAILKQRLFLGALSLHPDAIRHQGLGQLLGRVIESEAVESLALGGGFLVLFAGVELVLAGVVLGLGAGAGFTLGVLVLTLGTAAALGRSWYGRYQAWTEQRLLLTHDLVEKVVGHRTRLAQQRPEDWHSDEEQALEEYLQRSRRMDGDSACLAVLPQVWVAAAIAVLCWAQPVTGAPLAVSLGGILLAYRSLERLAGGVSQLGGAWSAWQRVKPLFAARPIAPSSQESAGAALEARGVSFVYPGRTEPVLSDFDLRLEQQQRAVLEGASGGGKSTLVSLLSGLRLPTSGMIYHGSVAAAPQFHENHVLTETMGFNALLARNRVPEPADIEEAAELFEELGLGPLLERMPAGLLQLVGESGWQLSHGERSRLYIARALLQNADLVILDESFAALDPENLKMVMECAARRAKSLLVIAHR